MESSDTIKDKITRESDTSPGNSETTKAEIAETTETTTQKADTIPSKTFKGPKKTTIEALHLLSEKTGKNHTQLLDLAVENLLNPPATVKSDVHKFNPNCQGCNDELLQRGYVLVDNETWNKVRHYV